jgi:hypothetical protein
METLKPRQKYYKKSVLMETLNLGKNDVGFFIIPLYNF